MVKLRHWHGQIKRQHLQFKGNLAGDFAFGLDLDRTAIDTSLGIFRGVSNQPELTIPSEITGDRLECIRIPNRFKRPVECRMSYRTAGDTHVVVLDTAGVEEADIVGFCPFIDPEQFRVVQQKAGHVVAGPVEVGIPAGLIPALDKLEFQFVLADHIALAVLQVIQFKFDLLHIHIGIHDEGEGGIFTFCRSSLEFIGINGVGGIFGGDPDFRADRPDLHVGKGCVHQFCLAERFDGGNHFFRGSQALEQFVISQHGDGLHGGEFIQFIMQDTGHEHGAGSVITFLCDRINICMERFYIFGSQGHVQDLFRGDGLIPDLHIRQRSFETTDIQDFVPCLIQRPEFSAIAVHDRQTVDIKARHAFFLRVNDRQMVPASRVDLEPAGADTTAPDTADTEGGMLQRIQLHADPDIITGSLIILLRIQESISLEPERNGIIKAVQLGRDLTQIQLRNSAFCSIKIERLLAKGSNAFFGVFTGGDHRIAGFVDPLTFFNLDLGKIDQRILFGQFRLRCCSKCNRKTQKQCAKQMFFHTENLS